MITFDLDDETIETHGKKLIKRLRKVVKTVTPFKTQAEMKGYVDELERFLSAEFRGFNECPIKDYVAIMTVWAMLVTLEPDNDKERKIIGKAAKTMEQLFGDFALKNPDNILITKIIFV